MINRRYLPIGISILIFFAINLLMVSSLAPQVFFKQLIAWLIGFGLFFIGKEINPRQITHHRMLIFIISCIFLLLPIILNSFTRGSRRWLYFGPISIQPSEVVKPWLLLFLSSNYYPLLHLIPVGIIMLQPDLGSAITVFALIIPIILYNSKLLKLGIIAILIGLLFSPIIWRFGLRDYQKNRIETFLNPTHDPLGQGYNLIQSQIAIGSGGLFGKGYRQGTQSQLLFLPEKHTDFVFAAITEELGLSSVLIIFFAYFILLKTLISKAYLTTNNTPLFFFTLGIVFQIWIQAFINIGMNIGIMPVTGIPLPFLSVGGSSIMALMFSLGIIYSS
jgi:rod shape determining protein RodA